MKKMIVLMLGLFMYSCGLSDMKTEMKKLTKESKTEMDKIRTELKLEKFDHTFSEKYRNGKTTKAFYVELANIDDSIDFEPYNDRIISLFEKSGYNFKDQDFIRIGYFKNFFAVDTYVSYKIDPKTKEIISVDTQ
jgi:antitoxin component YwqK of YwqJK toxin-antitoxin module